MQVVAIGASAGGIEAFRLFFEKMPANSGMAFVVVLHLSADRKSLLTDILEHWTEMPVVEATDGHHLAANTIHVIPPGVVVTMQGSDLHLRRLPAHVPREVTPIDTFFDSLATALGENAIGIVLSGTGHDGALGLKAIKARNGVTLAQGGNGSTPLHSGMPTSAIATGAVDMVLAVEHMPERILALRRDPIEIADDSEGKATQVDADRLRICELLRHRLGHDFSHYKENTFLRRVQRRMQVLGVAKLGEYVSRLESQRDEALLLFRDLLIGVTTFFRDAAAFDSVKHLVLPRLFEGKGASDTVRIWVPGCATGEEAYSIAMLLSEHMDGLDNRPRVQIFATDIDELAIETARTGRYPSTLVVGLSPERLERFFAHRDSGYVVRKEIRDHCTFSAHSLVRDPPFSRLDLISCRNLLIYLDVELQASVIPAFHYALVPGGILLLGSSETVVRHEGLFDPLDKEHRIFQRRDGPGVPGRLPQSNGARTLGRLPQQGSAVPSRPELRTNWTNIVGLANARVLERFAAPFAVVAADGTLVHYSSHNGNFLLPALGPPSRNVIDMARRDLRLSLRAALRNAVDTGRTIERAVTVGMDGDGSSPVTLIVEPMPGPDQDRPYLIVFKTTESAAIGLAEANPPGNELDTRGELVQLEREVRDTREQLQSLAEEHQTALEELRSSNEELHSVNEELQSTNEELETSKEEIQSINEELQIVNAQLSGKVDALNRANSDLRNLFESTRVATIFLDNDAIIRAFTPEVGSIYNLIPSDRGRPLTDIVSRLAYKDLRDDLSHVLDTLQPLERRVSRTDGSGHYLLRILPYRAPDSTVDGTVITFVDVTSIVQAEQHHRLLVDEMDHRVRDMLAVMTSLATETACNSETIGEFSDAFLGRVQALTAAYSLLSRENWSSVMLGDIVLEALAPFVAPDRHNLVLDGPEAALHPSSALAVGMAIHELATNAVKFGALSVPDGLVTVNWAVDQEGVGNSVAVTWTEQNGPAVSPPNKRGYGTALIERGLTHDVSGEGRLSFPPTGAQASLRVPLLVAGRQPVAVSLAAQ